MKVRELMSSPALTCRPNDSLAKAASMLWEHDCGMLPVIDAAGKVGAVITDRDICMGAYTKGRALGELRVADSMSKGVVTCRADDDLGAAVQSMIAHQLHRLPVVDEQGRPCGVLSLNDLALDSEQDANLTRDAMKALRAVCRHRSIVPAVVAPPAAKASEVQKPTAVAAPR